MPGVDEVVSCFEYKLELSAEFFVQMESVRMNLKKNEMSFPAESRTVRALGPQEAEIFRKT